MNQINRAVVVLKPKQPLLNWVNRKDESSEVSLKSARGDCSAYLVPELDSEDEGMAFLKRNFKTIFKKELYGWYIDPDMHPSKLTWEMFQEWFDIYFHSMVHDLGHDEIEYTD